METKIHEPHFSEEDLAKLPRWAQNRIKQMQASIDRHREEESHHKALVQMKVEWETARRKFIERNPTRVYRRNEWRGDIYVSVVPLKEQENGSGEMETA